MDAADLIAVLRQSVPDAPLEAVESVDMPTVVVGREHLVAVCRVLRDQPALQYAFLAEVTAADHLPAEPRYEVVYHLACLGGHYVVPGAEADPPPAPARLRLKVRVPGEAPAVPSVVSIWPAANWLEREVFDLFGIRFEGHPDLRRVLMPDDWEGHPLRKDYPVQIRKDTAAWSPLQLSPEEFAANVRARQELAARLAAPRRTDGE